MDLMKKLSWMEHTRPNHVATQHAEFISEPSKIVFYFPYLRQTPLFLSTGGSYRDTKDIIVARVEQLMRNFSEGEPEISQNIFNLRQSTIIVNNVDLDIFYQEFPNESVITEFLNFLVSIA